MVYSFECVYLFICVCVHMCMRVTVISEFYTSKTNKVRSMKFCALYQKVKLVLFPDFGYDRESENGVEWTRSENLRNGSTDFRTCYIITSFYIFLESINRLPQKMMKSKLCSQILFFEFLWLEKKKKKLERFFFKRCITFSF